MCSKKPPPTPKKLSFAPVVEQKIFLVQFTVIIAAKR
jgi:hypothetical protein